MPKLVAAYLAAALAFVALDAAWLSLTATRLYRAVLGDLLAPRIALAPGAAFYVLYIFGAVVLAVAPALRADSWARAAWSGALLGLVAYGTYDLTNQATLRTWALRLTLADMAWGAFATAAAALAGFFAARAAGRAF